MIRRIYNQEPQIRKKEKSSPTPMQNLILLVLFFLSGCQYITPDLNKDELLSDSSNDIQIKQIHYNQNPKAPIAWRVSTRLQPNGKYLKHGQATRYSKTGRILETVNYINDHIEGTRIFYHQNGKIWKEYQYLKGVKDGLCKRYDRLGNLTAEFEYKSGMHSTGLKEYTNLGKLRPQPDLTIEKIDRIKSYGKYILRFSLKGEGSKNIKRVDYYTGQLIEERYLPPNLTMIRPCDNKTAEIVVALEKGQYISRKIDIVAVAITQSGLKLIKKATIQLDIRGV